MTLAQHGWSVSDTSPLFWFCLAGIQLFKDWLWYSTSAAPSCRWWIFADFLQANIALPAKSDTFVGPQNQTSSLRWFCSFQKLPMWQSDHRMAEIEVPPHCALQQSNRWRLKHSDPNDPRKLFKAHGFHRLWIAETITPNYQNCLAEGRPHHPAIWRYSPPWHSGTVRRGASDLSGLWPGHVYQVISWEIWENVKHVKRRIQFSLRVDSLEFQVVLFIFIVRSIGGSSHVGSSFMVLVVITRFETQTGCSLVQKVFAKYNFHTYEPKLDGSWQLLAKLLSAQHRKNPNHRTEAI